MDFQIKQYNRLTSSIKTWMFECQADSKNDILYNMLSYPFLSRPFRASKQNDPELNEESLENISVKESAAKHHVGASPINNKTYKPTTNVRSKIQYFESKINSTRVRKSPKKATIGAEKFKPVVVEMILKKHIIDELQKSTTANKEVEIVQQSAQERHKHLPRKIEEKFVVNVFESRTPKSPSKPKEPCHGDLIKINSKLHIRGSETSYNSSETTCCSEQEELQRTYVVEKPRLDISGSVSLSNVTALLDSTISTAEMTETSTFVDDSPDILQEVHTQCHIIKQATKAVETCSLSKKFSNSREQLEAERILLLAELKRQLLLKEIRDSEYQEPKKLRASSIGASIIISNLEFPLMPMKSEKTANNFFIITCSSGSTLQASPLIELQNWAHFLALPDCFVFDNLRPESLVNFKIYQVQIWTTINRIRRFSKICCVNKADTRRQVRSIYHKDLLSGSAIQNKVLPSIFTLCGSLEVPVSDLVASNKFVLNLSPISSALYGTVKMATEVTNILTHRNLCDFVTVGREVSEGSIVWDRKWCRLDGASMRFWDYPSEEGLNAPKLVLDLRKCLTNEICIADKYFSKRSQTLLVEYCEGDRDSWRYFLSLDTKCEMKVWRDCLNSALISQRLNTVK